MNIAVAGGTGRVGSKVVNRLRDTGHLVVPLSPSTGVDTLTRQGLPEALEGVTVVVDVTNSPSTDEAAARWFFETSTHNLLAGADQVGVEHYIVLSILGVERIDTGYFRAKQAQEARVRQSGIPFTIVRTTQFFEFVMDIVDTATRDLAVHLAAVPVQPVAVSDVAAVIAHVATAAALNSAIEVAGREVFMLDELARQVLTAHHDDRQVIRASRAPYLGASLAPGDASLLPGFIVTPTTLAAWLGQPS